MVSKNIMLNKYGLNVGPAYDEQFTLLEPNNFIPSWEAGDEEKKEVSNALRNLREIAPTVYFNVPTGFEAIALAMKTDDLLRKTLLSRVQMAWRL